MHIRSSLAAALVIGVFPLARVQAHPEFQRDIVERTGRKVNCAYCHLHADGPEGTAPGQIGRLTPAELEQLGRARAALQPGAHADSPILNAFGDHLVESLGKTRFLELKLAPGELAGLLPPASDLDHDGIPDARELREGTHPLLESDGNPWLLFRTNFQRNRAQIALTFAATVLGLYGLRHLLQGFAVATRARTNDDDDER